LKNWKLKLSSLFIVLALVFTLGNTVQAETLDDLPLHLLETPTELSQLISSFSKLEFSMTMDEAGTIVEHTIEYEFLGVEEVNNVQADKGRIIPRGEMEEAAMNFWMADGEIVKLEMGGQEIPAEMAGMFVNEMLDFVFLPFSFFNQADFDEMEDENIKDIVIYTDTVGDLELEIYEIELTNIDDFDSGFLRMAEYEGMLLLIGYDYYENGNEYNFTVNNIELR